jgi:DNA replicative helicase MCM subunit Mcm2 (Cdc46/Mcm family)
MLEECKIYQCQNQRPKCGYTFSVLADPEQGYTLPQPKTCPRVLVVNGVKEYCKCTQLREIDNVCVDYQEIKLQDKMENLSFGTMPRSILVSLEGDLVDKVNPGDDVIVVGLVVRQWNPLKQGVRSTIDLAIRANSIRLVSSNDADKVLVEDSKQSFNRYWKYYEASPFSGRDKIVRSVCPQLYGLFYVKLCLLLTIIGGSKSSSSAENQDDSSISDSTSIIRSSNHSAGDQMLETSGINIDLSNNNHSEYTLNGPNNIIPHGLNSPDKNNSAPSSGAGSGSIGHPKRRSQSHLLIVGDPGCGKSQLLRFAASAIPR